MAKTFTLEAPNFCGILYDSDTAFIGPFIEAVPNGVVSCPDNYDQFFQFSSKEACFQKALELNPSCSKNKVFGEIVANYVDGSPDVVKGYVNQQIVLFCEYDYPDSNVVITYQWFDPEGTSIPTATSNVFSFTPSSKDFSGAYKCIVTSSGDHNWTGVTTFGTNLTLFDPLIY